MAVAAVGAAAPTAAATDSDLKQHTTKNRRHFLRSLSPVSLYTFLVRRIGSAPPGSCLHRHGIRPSGRRHMRRQAQAPDKNRAFICAVFTEVQRKCIRHFRGLRGCRTACVKPPHIRAVPGGLPPGMGRTAAGRGAVLPAEHLLTPCCRAGQIIHSQGSSARSASRSRISLFSVSFFRPSRKKHTCGQPAASAIQLYHCMACFSRSVA